MAPPAGKGTACALKEHMCVCVYVSVCNTHTYFFWCRKLLPTCSSSYLSLLFFFLVVRLQYCITNFLGFLSLANHISSCDQQEERSNSVTIGVSDEHIGLVVGRGGRNISEISQVAISHF